jgi:hypothetical protein
MIGNAGQSGRSSQTRIIAVDIKATDLEILRDFTHETLEGKFADEELRRLLVPTDLTKSDGTGAETMGLLDTTSRLRMRGVSRSTKVGEILRTACAVLRAADLAANCLRGALPICQSARVPSVTRYKRRLTTSGLASGLLGTSHC